MKITAGRFARIKEAADSGDFSSKALMERFKISERTLGRIKKAHSYEEYKALANGRPLQQDELETIARQIKADKGGKSNKEKCDEIMSKYDDMLEQYVDACNEAETYRTMAIAFGVGLVAVIVASIVIWIINVATH